MSPLSYEVREGKAVWGGRLLRDWVDDVGQAIVDRCAPALVILFGSVAEGTDGPDSDLDLLVVLDEAPPEDRRALMTELRRATRSAGVPRDIVVTSLAAFERNRRRPGTLEHESGRNGVVVHDSRQAA